MSEQESVSERELAQQLQSELFSPLAEQPPEEPAPEPEPLIVTDEPEQPEPPAEEPVPEQPAEPADEPEEEEGEPEPVSDDDNVVWARGRFGEDTDRWAKILRDQDQHISRLGNEKREAEQLAAQWYEYAQQAEQQVQTSSLPLSASEEQWAEQALGNPYAYARQAALNGNVQLYNAVLERVAEENPMVAGQVAAQVQMELQQLAAQQQAVYQPRPLEETLGASFQRLGLSLEEAGPQMMAKVEELGEYHPYVQAILGEDDGQRDLAIQAVFDLAREGRVTKRRVRDETREATIRREAELRREAAGVVTGAPHTPPPQEDPLLAAMTEEWKARRQWGGD